MNKVVYFFPMARNFAFLFLASELLIRAQQAASAGILVNGTKLLAETDANFVCATLDWWPHDKCNYNHCPWGRASVMNLDLSHPFLAKAIQGFQHLRIRIGGSLQDQIIYGIGSLRYPCHPFGKMKHGLFGYSKACLRMKRWDELNYLFKKTGAIVTFGLNALYGRRHVGKDLWVGKWDSTNARNFINYTVSRGYQIDSWEFGNELSGSGVGARVHAKQYGKDLTSLKAIIDRVYKNSLQKASLLAPGGFYDKEWFKELLNISGQGTVDALTHHIYNLGAGNDPNLVSKILDPHHLSAISETFRDLEQTIDRYGHWATAWVGESGGAYNSGGPRVSNTFVNSFWYLDQLGMAAKYNTKVYCRQTLIGGHYGLINKTTFVPNPDYYSALLWHQLMGKGVLNVSADASPYLRAYAHCAKGREEGITLLLINLSNQTQFTANLQDNTYLHVEESTKRESFLGDLKSTVSWVGNEKEASERGLFREEYHLTPKKGNLQSQTMVLNGVPLDLTDHGDIADLHPVHHNVNSSISIAPLSIAFIVFPNFDAQACRLHSYP